jgi:adenylate cyclase
MEDDPYLMISNKDIPEFTESRLSEQVTIELEQNVPTVNTNVNLDNNEKMKVEDYLIAFSGQSHSYCVGLVDMVNSTKIISRISQKRWSKFYSIFLNFMIKSLNSYDAVPFKNGGDSIFYYFPDTSKNLEDGIVNSIECSLKMIELHGIINETTQNEKLPDIDYRISMDYGSVVIMNQNRSSSVDMWGPPVNMCSKINHHANKNQIVIGGDLYQIAKKFDDFKFKQTNGYSIGLKNDYPVYVVTR